MQRIKVDLPVPEGPMTAVMPVGATLRSTARSTGTPRRYSFVSPRMSSAGASRARACATALLLLGRFLARGLLARAFLLVRRAVERRARLLRDLAHDRPVLLVGDREEAVGAAERLLHLGRETVIVEAFGQRLNQIGVEVVRISE